MFLHLGNNYMIHTHKVIAILDLDTAGNNQTSLTLLNNLQRKKEIENIAEKGKEKSFVITDNGNFLSPISSSTLLKRSANKILI